MTLMAGNSSSPGGERGPAARGTAAHGTVAHSTDSHTTDEWEARVGQQLRALRISAGHDQSQLAELAGVSLGAVRNLETGKGSTLKTLVRVTRALGRTDWLAAISPEITVSPIAVLRSGPEPRSRVYRERRR